MGWKDTLKLIAGTSFVTLIRFIPIVAIGVLLNWIFFLIFSPILFDKFILTDIGVAGRSSFGAILALLPIGIVLTVFLAVFPILYLLIAKSYAVKSGIRYIYRKKATAIFEYFIPKLVEVSGDLYQENTTVIKVREISAKSVAKMKNMPKPIRMLYIYLVRKIPLQQTFSEVTKDTEIIEQNYGMIATGLNEKLSSHIEEELLNPSLKFFFLLIVLNFIAMYWVLSY
jgi:hypothetical protein